MACHFFTIVLCAQFSCKRGGKRIILTSTSGIFFERFESFVPQIGGTESDKSHGSGGGRWAQRSGLVDTRPPGTTCFVACMGLN